MEGVCIAIPLVNSSPKIWVPCDLLRVTILRRLVNVMVWLLGRALVCAVRLVHLRGWLMALLTVVLM